jgi:superfamily II DNA or RNA helicase
MLWVPQESITHKLGMRQKLTVFPKFENKESIETFIDGEMFGIPRNFTDIPVGTEDQTILPEKKDFEFTGKLRQVQKEMFEDWQSLYDKGINDWIIEADTGVGKTILMLKIACELKVPFLVIVPLERLMTYWIDQIKKFTTIKEVGIVRQKDCQYKEYFASVGLIHSVCKDKYPEEFKDHFGLIICDELHSTGAEQFSQVLPMFKARHRLGASATLERQDGMEKLYYFHLGKNIITTEIKTQPKPTILYYDFHTMSGKLPIWIDKYDRIKVRAYMLSMLARNSKRNELIANFADILINKNIQTLIIGDRITQLEEIQQYLIEKGHDDTGLYIGKTPDKEKRRIEKEASCILATMKMLEIGIDIDTLRGLIFATPKSNVTQVVGRIRRINPTVPDPVVIDIVDTYHKEAKGWFNSRKKWYKQENFPIIEVTK